MTRPDFLYKIDDYNNKNFGLVSRVRVSGDLYRSIFEYFSSLTYNQFPSQSMHYKGIPIETNEFLFDIIIIELKDWPEEIVYDIREDVEYRRATEKLRKEFYATYIEAMLTNRDFGDLYVEKVMERVSTK